MLLQFCGFLIYLPLILNGRHVWYYLKNIAFIYRVHVFCFGCTLIQDASSHNRRHCCCWLSSSCVYATFHSSSLCKSKHHFFFQMLFHFVFSVNIRDTVFLWKARGVNVLLLSHFVYNRKCHCLSHFLHTSGWPNHKREPPANCTTMWLLNEECSENVHICEVEKQFLYPLLDSKGRFCGCSLFCLICLQTPNRQCRLHYMRLNRMGWFINGGGIHSSWGCTRHACVCSKQPLVSN
jgi:hypothetical protein